MDARMYTTDETGIPRRSAQSQKVGSDSESLWARWQANRRERDFLRKGAVTECMEGLGLSAIKGSVEIQ